jgi:hypothetical protein
MIRSAAVGGIGSHSSRTMTSRGPTCESANWWPATASVSSTLGEYLLDLVIMSDRFLSHLERAQTFADSNGISLHREEPFGFGMDGTIWRTSRHSVIKTFEHERNFEDELECYRRFAAAGIEAISGFAVPELLAVDAKLKVLEISIVRPPFLLDFGKVYLDRQPPYWEDDEIMENWHAEGRENFGKRWATVMSLVRMLESYGIFYVDPKPGNVMFGDEGC